MFNYSFHVRGGKVAMALALHPELPSDLLTDLIVSDIAPVRAKVSQDTVQHIRAMEIIQSGNISTRKEADEIMSEHEQVPLIVLAIFRMLMMTYRTLAFDHFFLRILRLTKQRR
jgi:hypothetical protein